MNKAITFLIASVLFLSASMMYQASEISDLICITASKIKHLSAKKYVSLTIAEQDGKQQAYQDCKAMLEEVIEKLRNENNACVTTHKGTFDDYLSYKDGLNYAIKLLKGKQ